jgi:nicotinamidase-related amidase
MADTALNPTKTAVVAVDMINHQLTRGKCLLGEWEAAGRSVDYFVERAEDLMIPATQRLMAHCRDAGAKVVYLRIGTLASDYSDGLPALRAGFARWGAHDGSWACSVIDELEPEPGDLSLIKTGSGGFLTSGLDSHLRNLGIENVLYTGVMTNGCVLLSLSQGYDLGYNNFLVSDATATYEPHLQDNTEEIVAVYMGEVTTVDDIIPRLAA